MGQRWCTDVLSSGIHFSSLQKNVLSVPADECWECEESIVASVRQLALIIEHDSIRLALGPSAKQDMASSALFPSNLKIGNV